MTISEDRITHHLNWLLESSDPGDSLHHLVTVAVDAAEPIGPFGVADDEKLQVCMFAIAADDSVEDVEQFVGKVIASAAIDHAEKRMQVLFAALSQEVWAMEHEPTEAEQKLIAERRMHEVAGSQEATVVYGAARDGRRWRSRRWLTGANAGQNLDVEMLLGPPRPHEFFGLRSGQMIRRLAGQPR